MLISACPVNGVARMVDTAYYVSISSKANGVVYKTDGSTIINTVTLNADIVSTATQTSYSAAKFVTLAQVGTSSQVILGGKVHLYDYTSNAITKTSSSSTSLTFVDCLDSSTCIGLDVSLTNFNRITN